MAERLFDLFELGPTEAERLQAAGELARLGTRTREPVLSRGSRWTAAKGRIPLVRVESLFRNLTISGSLLQAETVAVLGEWAGEEAVPGLRRLAAESTDETVQRAAVGALAKIGGPEAVRALLTVSESDSSEAVRAWALDVFEALAAGSPAPPESAAGRGAAGGLVLGAVRTRGSGRTQTRGPFRKDSAGSGEEDLDDRLRQLAEGDRSGYVRTRGAAARRALKGA